MQFKIDLHEARPEELDTELDTINNKIKSFYLKYPHGTSCTDFDRPTTDLIMDLYQMYVILTTLGGCLIKSRLKRKVTDELKVKLEETRVDIYKLLRLVDYLKIRDAYPAAST